MSKTKCSLLSTTLFAAALLTLISEVHSTNVRTNARKDQPRKTEQGSCSSLRNWWTSKGLDASKLSKLSMKNETLHVCGQGPSCCTPAIEGELVRIASSEVTGALDKKMDRLKQSYNSLVVKYDSFCLELINASAADLNDMYRKTYGQFYMKEARFFSSLFKQLGSYYRGQDVDLIKFFENFFKTLMQKMFALFNTNSKIDKRYLNCVVEKMDALKPFGDVPQKLSNQVKRAMVAARTFHEGLVVGKEFIAAVQKIRLPPSCANFYVRMTSCPICSGLSNQKPCQEYCHSTMESCYALYKQIDQPWSAYIDQMSKVMERLEGPFNLVGIISPINVKVSEAIMNYQEHQNNVNDKVFKGCGTLDGEVRAKRSSSSDPGTFRSTDRSTAGANLDKILQEVREKVLGSRELFSNLASSSCTPLLGKPSRNSQNTTSVDSNCWNGTSKVRHWASSASGDVPVVSSASEEEMIDVKSVEVKAGGSSPKDDQLIKEQVHKLSTATSKLINSYHGLDVMRGTQDRFEELEEDDAVHTESGSGYGVDDDEEDDYEEDGEFSSTRPPGGVRSGDRKSISLTDSLHRSTIATTLVTVLLHLMLAQ